MGRTKTMTTPCNVKIQKQLFKHDPDNGTWGDCHRTAYACILGVEPQEVPNFAEGDPDGFHERERAWLEGAGLVAINFAFDGDVSVENILSTMEQLNPGTPYIIGGTSATGVGHSVVCCGGEIVCDPSIDNVGIVSPLEGHWWVTYVARKLHEG